MPNCFLRRTWRALGPTRVTMMDAVCALHPIPLLAGPPKAEARAEPLPTADTTRAVSHKGRGSQARRQRKLQREIPPGIFVPVRGELTHTLATSDTSQLFPDSAASCGRISVQAAGP